MFLVLFQEVLQRHPLHTLAQVIQYSDGHGTGNIVLKIGQVNKTVFSCYVFQCLSEVKSTVCLKQKEKLSAFFSDLYFGNLKQFW